MLLRVVVLIDCVNEMVMVGGSRVYANLSTCDSYYRTLSTCIHVTQINPEITSALASGCVVKCQKRLPRVITHY